MRDHLTMEVVRELNLVCYLGSIQDYDKEVAQKALENAASNDSLTLEDYMRLHTAFIKKWGRPGA